MLTNVESPESYPKISYSEMSTLLTCSKKHDYAYRQGLVPARQASYFSKGKLLHEAMAVWLEAVQSGLPDVTAAPVWGRALSRFMENGDTLPPESDIEQIRRQFLDFVKNADMTGIEVLGVEEEFYVDLGWKDKTGSPVLLHGIFDARVRDADTEETWVVEHKTAGRAWSENQFTFDFQGPLYIEAAEALTGQRPVGLTYQFFLPKRWEQKQRFITPQESVGILREGQNAIDIRDSGIVARQPQFGCNMCGAYRQLCAAEMLGGDSSHLRENFYTVDEEKAARFAEVES